MKRDFNNFSEFYPYHLSQHSNIICRRLHFIGLILSLFTLAVVVATSRWIYLPSVLIIGYGFGFIGHFLFEKNTPAVLNYPLYSLLSEFVMAKDIMTRKINF
jgi:hypothetical protein